MSLSAGARLGPYEIVSPLGAGGMGEVYRARDARLSREVAIKLLPPELAGNPERLQRFEQEARLVGTLNHPNVLAVYDIGNADGVPYLVSELLEGQTLRERLRGIPLGQRKAVEIAVQIAHGLAAAHERGIVHRDLKPENIFVTADGRVKILDFGLAKTIASSLRASGSETLTVAGPQTQEGMVLGTVGYMSPEQVRGHSADQRSDIFSFGVILYEMLSGQRAFAGDSSVEVMNSILKEEPPEITTLRPNISHGLDRLVRRCLEKVPEERFQSAHDLAFALDAVGPSSAITAQQALPMRTAQRRQWLMAVGAAVTVLLVSAIAYLAGVRTTGARANAPAFRQLNYRRGAIFQAAFAPDGKTVVYSAATEGNIPDVYVITPEYPEAKPLGLHGVQFLAISSRGELALLTSAKYLGHHRLFTGTLATMPLGGGAPREILEGVRQADWSPDGTALAIIRDVNGRDRLEYPIGTVLAETGGYFSDLRFSRRGDRIAFFDHPQRYDDRGSLALVDLKGSGKKLSPDYWGTEGLAWSPTGDSIYYSAGTGYTDLRIYTADLSGHVRAALSSAGGLAIQDILTSGQWLAMRYQENFGMAGHVPGSAGERDLGWLSQSVGPVLSRDGDIVLFSEESAAAGEHYKVCLRRTDGSAVVPLGDGEFLDLSHDGRWALADLPITPAQLMLYPTGAGQPRQMDRGNLVAYSSGHWFPDDKHILVCGTEAGHAGRCYIQDTNGGTPKPVTPEGATDGLISPDGKRILATSGNSWSIYPVDGGASEPVRGLKTSDTPVRWTEGGDSLVVLVHDEIPARLERVSLHEGGRHTLFSIVPTDRTGVLNIDAAVISGDEKYYAYNYRQIDASLFLIEGAK